MKNIDRYISMYRHIYGYISTQSVRINTCLVARDLVVDKIVVSPVVVVVVVCQRNDKPNPKVCGSVQRVVDALESLVGIDR